MFGHPDATPLGPRLSPAIVGPHDQSDDDSYDNGEGCGLFETGDYEEAAQTVAFDFALMQLPAFFSFV
jgi:hypothetical protein